MKIKLTNSPLNPTPQSKKNGEGGVHAIPTTINLQKNWRGAIFTTSISLLKKN
jgi:hypothetical protein